MNNQKDIGFAVRRLSNLIKRDVEASRSKLGIDPVKGINGWAIKYFYDNRDMDVFQKDFENKFSIRRSTASRILTTMEQKGLIERKSVESDARLKKIVLTDKAIEIHNKITEEIRMREEKLRKNISDDELNVFFNVMEKLCVNMEVQND